MKQSNSRQKELPDYCDTSIKKCILAYPQFYDLPILLSDGWNSPPEDSRELDDRLEKFTDILRGINNKYPYHFLKLMLQEEIYENTVFSENIKNECVERACSGGRINISTIENASIKLFMIQKHIRFLQNAFLAYLRISRDYDNLPVKTNITKADIIEELTSKMALSQMRQSLSDDDIINQEPATAISSLSEEAEIFQSLPTYMDETDELFVKFIKDEGITFDELKRNYPAYRSKFQIKNAFTDCVLIYSYHFFLNNFTYDTREVPAMFAHSTVEYLKYAVRGSDYNSYRYSTRNSYLEKFVSMRGSLPYEAKYEDIFVCDIAEQNDSATIGIFFPQSNSNYTELLI